MRRTGQLPLPFSSGRRFAAVDFCEAPSNREAVAWLARTADWPDLRLALWGAAGGGKTHLLHIWAARVGSEVWSGPALLDGPLHALPRGLALDDADAVADPTTLLHLLNAASEASLPVLLAARDPPARWTVRLPDLASRLRAIAAIEIGPPEDSLLSLLLTRLLAERQLRLPEAVRAWLLARLPRTAAALGEAVARLDAVSLEVSRDITVPLAREVLADIVALSPHEFSGTERPPSQGDAGLL